MKDILRPIPQAARVNDDWGQESAVVRLEVDPDRANLAGVSNMDVARSSTAAMSGMNMTTLREGDKQIPVVARLRMEERAQLSDIQNLYVYSSQSTAKVPLSQISNIVNALESQRIRRQEHFRTISVRSQTATGSLPSEVISAAMPKLTALQRSMPPGYGLIIGGEYAKQTDGFKNLGVVMAISIAAIFLALVVQFNHAVKPLLVFAAVPYGVVGALLALYIMGAPFGFMAFLGIASLIGVIVSHVIVLFDFIEEMHEKGEPLERALGGRGNHSIASGDDYRWRHGAGAFPVGASWRAAVAAAVLFADWRLGSGHLCHPADGSGDVFDFRARPENREVGRPAHGRGKEFRGMSPAARYFFGGKSLNIFSVKSPMITSGFSDSLFGSRIFFFEKESHTGFCVCASTMWKEMAATVEIVELGAIPPTLPG